MSNFIISMMAVMFLIWLALKLFYWIDADPVDPLYPKPLKHNADWIATRSESPEQERIDNEH